jgi:hypothetical protein
MTPDQTSQLDSCNIKNTNPESSHGHNDGGRRRIGNGQGGGPYNGGWRLFSYLAPSIPCTRIWRSLPVAPGSSAAGEATPTKEQRSCAASKLVRRSGCEGSSAPRRRKLRGSRSTTSPLSMGAAGLGSGQGRRGAWPPARSRAREKGCGHQVWLVLTVLTTKFRPSKPRVREEYTTSFMHIFVINKVP